jgi:hypothetical protein
MVPRQVPQSRLRCERWLAVGLLGLALAACVNRADPVVAAGTPLDLGADVFLGDGGGVDAEDLGGGEDLEAEADATATGIGRACRLFGDDCDVGLKCAPGLDGRGSCVPAGDLGEGSSCGADGVDDCGAGLLCLDLREEPDGAELRCYRLCRTARDDCAVETSCTVSLGIPGVGACR